jgi:hypothetical protein
MAGRLDAQTSEKARFVVPSGNTGLAPVRVTE